MIRSMWAASAALAWFASVAGAEPSGEIYARAQEQTSSASAAGQPPTSSFANLALMVSGGDTVYVVEASGQETRGRVVGISDVALAVTVEGVRREFLAERVRRVDLRRRDSVRNGLLIGAAAGAALGFGMGRSADSPDCPRSGIECGQGALIGTVGGALWGAIGGWITDALIRKREVVYRAPQTFNDSSHPTPR